jgi:hypothetical protein
LQNFFTVQNNSSLRYGLGLITAESSTLTGSDLNIAAYTNAGAYSHNALQLTRGGRMVLSGSPSTFGELYVGGTSGMLIQQSTDGNTYMRPLNATSTLYIGTNASNYLSLSQTGVFSILGSGTFNKIPSNEGLYYASGTRGTTATNANNFTQQIANGYLTFTNTAADGATWNIGTSGFWSFTFTARPGNRGAGLYRVAAVSTNVTPSATASADRLLYFFWTDTSSNEHTQTFVGRLLSGQLIKMYSTIGAFFANQASMRVTLLSAI